MTKEFLVAKLSTRNKALDGPSAKDQDSDHKSSHSLKDLPASAAGAGMLAQRFTSWVETLSQTLCSDSSLGYHRSGVALFLLSLTIGATVCVAGAAPITGPWDMAPLLDGGWRILNGQVPHTDFHNPIGALTYLMIAFGMKIGAPSVSAVAFGTVMSLALVAPLAWHIASKRLPWAIAFVFVCFIGLFLVTPRPPAFQIRETTYAMIYNRQGYVLLSLLLLCVFLKPRASAKQCAVLDGILVGALLALMLYCKVTYFLAGAALALVAAILAALPLRWLLGSALGFLAVSAAFFLAFQIGLYAYLQDIAMAGQSQSSAMRLKLLYQAIVGNATWIYMLIFGLGLWSWAEIRQEKSRSPFFVWFVTGSIVAGALLISSGNTAQLDGKDDPLYFVAAVIALELFRRRNVDEVAQPGTSISFAHTASLMLLLPVLGGTILVRDFASCAYAVAWNAKERSIIQASQRLHSFSLRDFYVPSSTQRTTAYWLAHDHPAKINDGIDLLRANLREGDRITTIALANPFSFALDLTPARDHSLWWDLGVSFDQSRFPPAKEFFGDASIVMVPRLANRTQGCCFETVDVLLGLYGDYLRAHFHEQASTDTWGLYRRN
jgi:hypothetical protein